MIKHHPTYQQLEQFAQGQLAANTAVVISTHLDLCEHCRARSQEIENQLAEQMFEQAALPLESAGLSDMMMKITSLPANVDHEKRNVNRVTEGRKTLELDGKQFPIPRALQRLVPAKPDWSKLAGKLWHAPVSVAQNENIHFIFMEKGGQVPEHTHRGTEYSLVLDGAFTDEMDNYLTGDFTELNHDHKHKPFTEEDEGCLVLSVVDKPLHFTSGVARLLNPFSHLLLK